MVFKQFEIWLADLNPSIGTEPGKIRPVIIVQSDLLNMEHPSTIICPITTNISKEAEVLRLKIKSKQLIMDSEILIDQIRAIDNRRFIKKIGVIGKNQVDLLRQNLKIILDL